MSEETEPIPVLTEEEVNGYKLFSKECAKIEKDLYGKTSLQAPSVKALLGKDTKIDWAQTFEWILTIKDIFDNEGVQTFLTKIAPDMVKKLLEIEEKTETFLTLARALINGMGWGTVPVPSSSPPGDPMMPSGPSVPEKLAVVPPAP
jgi:hypothetical protein